jgi:hypothetical protein
MHSAGWELDRQQLTLSGHVGDLGGQVWRMCGLAGMMRAAAGIPLRSNEPKCANTREIGGVLTCATHCAEGRHFHVIWECFGKFM